MNNLNQIKFSDGFIDFFPCTTMKQVQITEMLIFGLTPGLTSFTRDITPAERAAGVIYPHVLVTKTEDGITRQYGTMLGCAGGIQ
jgi:hypothetical protein